MELAKTDPLRGARAAYPSESMQYCRRERQLCKMLGEQAMNVVLENLEGSLLCLWAGCKGSARAGSLS